jgi:cytochrome P450
MDITTDFLFGRSAGSLSPDADPAKKEFSAAFSMALSRMAFRGGLGIFMDIVPDRIFQQSCKIVHRFVDNLVQQALTCRPSGSELKSSRYVYLHEISDSTSDPIKLRDHALNILIAGRDSTAALLSFTFLLLAQNQDVWRLLCSEIKELEGATLSLDRLRELKYLHYIIHEG